MHFLAILLVSFVAWLKIENGLLFQLLRFIIKKLKIKNKINLLENINLKKLGNLNFSTNLSAFERACNSQHSV